MSGGWKQQGKRAKTTQAVEPKPRKQSLSAWMAANGYHQAVVDSVAAGSCVKQLLDKFKNQRQSAKGLEGNLSRGQRAEYLGAREDIAAVQKPDATLSPSLRAGSKGGKGKGKGPAKGKGKGKGSGQQARFDRIEYVYVNKGKGKAEPNRKQLAAKVASLERKLAAARSSPSGPSPERSDGGAPAEEAEVASGWECTFCLARHDKSKRSSCRLCSVPRPSDAAPNPQAAKLAAEEVAKKRTALLAAKEAISAAGGMAASIKEIDARLEELRKCEQASADTCMESEKLSPVAQVFAANTRVTEANAFVDKMVEKCTAFEVRMSAMQADLTSLQRALNRAKQEAQQAQEALSTASMLLSAGNPSAEAMPSAPAAGEASVSALFQRFWESQDTQKHYQQHNFNRKKEGLKPLNAMDWINHAFAKQEASRAFTAAAAQASQREATTDPPSAAARPQQGADIDTRLSSRQQQQHPKSATLEASSESSHARMAEQATRATKEERDRLLEAARRDDAAVGEALGVDSPVES